MGTYFIRQNGGGQQGPFEEEKILRWIAQGRVRPDMELSPDGQRWIPVSEHRLFASATVPTAVPIAPVVRSRAVQPVEVVDDAPDGKDASRTTPLSREDRATLHGWSAYVEEALQKARYLDRAARDLKRQSDGAATVGMIGAAVALNSKNRTAKVVGGVVAVGSGVAAANLSSKGREAAAASLQAYEIAATCADEFFGLAVEVGLTRSLEEVDAADGHYGEILDGVTTVLSKHANWATAALLTHAAPAALIAKAALKPDRAYEANVRWVACQAPGDEDFERAAGFLRSLAKTDSPVSLDDRNVQQRIASATGRATEWTVGALVALWAALLIADRPAGLLLGTGWIVLSVLFLLAALLTRPVVRTIVRAKEQIAVFRRLISDVRRTSEARRHGRWAEQFFAGSVRQLRRPSLPDGGRRGGVSAAPPKSVLAFASVLILLVVRSLVAGTPGSDGNPIVEAGALSPHPAEAGVTIAQEQLRKAPVDQRARDVETAEALLLAGDIDAAQRTFQRLLAVRDEPRVRAGLASATDRIAVRERAAEDAAIMRREAAATEERARRVAESAERDARAARDRREAEAEARRAAERAAVEEKRREAIVAAVPGTYRAAEASICNLYTLTEAPLRDIQFDVVLREGGGADVVLRIKGRVRGQSTGTWQVDFERTDRIMAIALSLDLRSDSQTQGIPASGAFVAQINDDHGPTIAAPLFGLGKTDCYFRRIGEAAASDPAVKPMTKADLVGTYEATPESLGGRQVTFRLVLSKDGTFANTYKSGTRPQQVHRGTWALQGDRVTLEATTLNGTRMRESKTTEVRLDGAELVVEDFRLRRKSK